MSWLSSAWSSIRGKSAQPGTVYGDPQTEGALGGLLAGAVPFGSPPRRGERELMVAAKRHPILHSIVNRIGHDIAATPWQLFLARSKSGVPEKRWAMRDGGAAQRRSYRVNKATGQLRKDVEEVTDHPLLDLFHSFNPLMTRLIAFKLVQAYIELKGEAFLGIERNAAGMPVQLWPVPGYWIYRTPYRGSPYYHVNYGAWVASLREEDVIWLKHPDLENPYMRGSGIGESLGDELEIDEYAAKTQKALFYNHGIPAGIVSLEGASQAVVDRAKEEFNQKYGGFWNAAKIFWAGQKVDLKQLSLDFVDSNIGPLRKDERDKIVQTFGVPPEILGILDHSNRATIAEATPIYAGRVLMPRLEFLRTSLQERLVPEFDDRLVLDFVDPTPDDQAFRLQVATAAPWSRSKNEWRELQNLPPVDGGDDEFPPMPTSAPKAPGGGGGETQSPEGKGFRFPWRRSARGGLVPESSRVVIGDGTREAVVPLARAGAEEDDSLRESALDEVVGAVDDGAVTIPMEELTENELRRWMAEVADQTGLEVDFQLVNPKIAEFVRERSLDKVRGLAKVNDTTRDELRASLAEGIDAGESIPALAARVRSVFDDAQGYRATNIARTETTRAAGWGNLTAFREGGAEAKEWVATRDSKTRDDHREMDGQVVAIDDPFLTPGGLEGDHPGDFDDPEQDCGCRCTMSVADRSELEEADKSMGAIRARRKKTLERRDAAWKAFDAAVTQWETKARKVLRRAFGAQRAAVLAALEARR